MVLCLAPLQWRTWGGSLEPKGVDPEFALNAQVNASGEYVELVEKSPKLGDRAVRSVTGNFVYNVKVTRKDGEVYYKHYPIVIEGTRITRWTDEISGVGDKVDFANGKTILLSDEYKKTLYFNDGIRDGYSSTFHPYVTGSGTVTLSDGASYPVRVDGELH